MQGSCVIVLAARPGASSGLLGMRCATPGLGWITYCGLHGCLHGVAGRACNSGASGLGSASPVCWGLLCREAIPFFCWVARPLTAQMKALREMDGQTPYPKNMFRARPLSDHLGYLKHRFWCHQHPSANLSAQIFSANLENRRGSLY